LGSRGSGCSVVSAIKVTSLFPVLLFTSTAVYTVVDCSLVGISGCTTSNKVGSEFLVF